MAVFGPVFFLAIGIDLFSESQTVTFASQHGRGSGLFKLIARAIDFVSHVGLDEGIRIAFVIFALICITFALLVVGANIYSHGAGAAVVVGPSTISISGRPWGNRTLAFANVASVKIGAVRARKFLYIKPRSGRTIAIAAAWLPSGDAFNEMCAAVDARVRKSNSPR